MRPLLEVRDLRFRNASQVFVTGKRTRKMMLQWIIRFLFIEYSMIFSNSKII